MKIVNGINRRGFMQVSAGAAAGLALGSGKLLAQDGSFAVDIASTSGNTGMTFNEMMTSGGFYEKYGVHPEFIVLSDGTKIVSSLISGNADICRASGFGQVLTAIDRGAELKIVGGGELKIPQAVYTKNPDIKTLKDLEGRSVGAGAPGALLHHMMTTLLLKHDVDISKVNFVNIGSSSAVFRAILAGTVDAGPSQNNVHYNQEEYGIHSLAEFWTELPNYPYQACYASIDAIVNKRETLVRTLAAFQDFYNFLQTEEALEPFTEAYMKVTGDKDPARAKAQWQFVYDEKPFSITLPRESIDYLQKANIDAGIQREEIPYDRVADLSLAEDALKLIEQTG